VRFFQSFSEISRKICGARLGKAMAALPRVRNVKQIAGNCERTE
jgi:hypothetical protein